MMRYEFRLLSSNRCLEMHKDLKVSFLSKQYGMLAIKQKKIQVIHFGLVSCGYFTKSIDDPI